MRRLALVLLLLSYPLNSGVKRIVSTAPSITQTLYALGLGDRVVGVTNYCHYPPDAEKKAKIGTYLDPDIEAISALHPDLVVVAKLPNHLEIQLDHLHIKSIVVDHATFDDVFSADEAIARAAGEPGAGLLLNKTLRSAIEQVKARTAGKLRSKAVMVVGHNPDSLTGLFVAGAGSYFSEILNIAGADNSFADTKMLYPKVSLEEVLRRNPDFIFEISGEGSSNKEVVRRLWSAQTSLRAVSDHHVFPVPSELFIVPGPRVAEASRYLARLLHPDAGV